MLVKHRSKAATIPLRISDFKRLNGSGECYGINGIRNLFGILKNDVKVLCKEYNLHLPKQPGRLLELRPLMFPFNIYWDEWSTSNYCNLSQQEIAVINYYRKKSDLTWVGNQLGLTYELALTYLSKGIRKLKYPETMKLFQKWKDYKHLNQEKPDEFLDVPLEGLHNIFPHRVYRILQMFGKTVREVLEKTTLTEMHRYRNFGIKAENELRMVLKKHQCLHLLRK